MQSFGPVLLLTALALVAALVVAWYNTRNSMADEKDLAQVTRLTGPKFGQRYRHFKGGTYLVLCTAVRESDLVLEVVYMSEKTQGIWTRPLDEFLGMHPTHNVQRFTPCT